MIPRAFMHSIQLSDSLSVHYDSDFSGPVIFSGDGVSITPKGDADARTGNTAYFNQAEVEGALLLKLVGKLYAQALGYAEEAGIVQPLTAAQLVSLLSARAVETKVEQTSASVVSLASFDQWLADVDAGEA